MSVPRLDHNEPHTQLRLDPGRAAGASHTDKDPPLHWSEGRGALPGAGGRSIGPYRAAKQRNDKQMAEGRHIISRTVASL